MSEELKMASFFAGVGGIDLGFEQTGLFKTVYANEIDKYAVKTFEENFDIEVDHRDIRDVSADDIPQVDVFLAGWPCQPFSQAGLRQGFKDLKGRGDTYFELERLYQQKQPRIIFLENVKNLVGHDSGRTFRVISESLEKAGYHIKFQVMNGMDYGNVPQNRERIYVVGFKDYEQYKSFEFPRPIRLTTTLQDVIDFEKKQEDIYYYSPEKHKFYDELDQGMINLNSIYQWRRVYVRENKSGVVPTLTANMGTGGHNVPLVRTKYGIRKLTARETFNVQGYPENYKFPKSQSNTQLYKQAGNSVVVPVVNRIAEEIVKVAVKDKDRVTTISTKY